MTSYKTYTVFLLGACALLLFLEVLPTFVSFGGGESGVLFNTAAEHSPTARISDLGGQASLGEAAIMIRATDGAPEILPLCRSLSQSLWGMVLLVFIVVLAFNLWESSKVTGRAGGVFEIILTAAFLGIWIYADECRTALWFPWLVLKSGLILFIFASLAGDRRETLF